MLSLQTTDNSSGLSSTFLNMKPENIWNSQRELVLIQTSWRNTHLESHQVLFWSDGSRTQIIFTPVDQPDCSSDPDLTSRFCSADCWLELEGKPEPEPESLLSAEFSQEDEFKNVLRWMHLEVILNTDKQLLIKISDEVLEFIHTPALKLKEFTSSTVEGFWWFWEISYLSGDLGTSPAPEPGIFTSTKWFLGLKLALIRKSQH